MKVRFYNDPESGEPHMARHGVNEQEARDVLVRPLEDCPVRRVPGWPWAGQPPGGIFG